MISIDNIKSYIPKGNLNIKKKYKNINKNFLIEKIGTNAVPRKRSNEDVVSMCIKAFKKLKNKKLPNLKVLILCTQNPEKNGLPHNSAIIHAKLGLSENIATFDISQGCAGYVYCLKVCENFLNYNDQALIFTCDPYSKIIKKGDFNTEILFGDAATVSVIKKCNKGQIIKDYSFFSNTLNNKVINNFNGYLEMNGRGVMSFAEKYVEMEIKNILKKNKISINDIDKFYLHQGSKHIINKITKILNVENTKVPLCIKNIGNTISSSIPILLEKDDFKKNKYSILCGFGVGLSISTCIIKKS